MNDREPIEVTVLVRGRELVAGTLWFHERGKPTASFRYADPYLTSPGSYALDLGLPRTQVSRMADAYETDQRRVARSLR